MPDLSADQIITQKHKRNFLQFGRANATNAPVYAGQNSNYLKIEGVSNPESGGVDPIWVHDPRRPGKFKLVGRSRTAPDLAEATLVFLEKHGGVPRQLATLGCFSAFELSGACGDLSDFVGGWKDYVLVYANGEVTDKDLGDRSAWGDSDDQIEDSLTAVFSDIFAVGALGFGEKAGTEAEREVIDVVYGISGDCGNCDVPENYTNRIYALTKSSGAGSPGTPAEVVYTVDGATWANQNITGLGGTTDPTAIDIVGQYLVVLVSAENALYYSPINQITGVPDSTWTKVTTGFVATKTPNDIYVAGPNEAYIAAEGGYIYKLTDVAAGVSVLSAGVATTADLVRIHGYEDVIVAVGESGTIIKSENRGATFATTTTSPTSATVRAVAVKDGREFWIGTSGGLAYFTLNGGETWVAKSFAGLTVIDDIVFVNSHVGYLAGRTSTPAARLFGTWDGGATWTRDKNRFLNLPTFSYINRVATPRDGDSTTASNNVTVGGLSGGGTDGIILQGVASRT